MPNSDVTVEVIYSKKIVKQEVQIPDAVEDAEKVEDVLLESLKQDSSFKEVVENNNVKVDVQVSEDKVNTAEKEEIEEKLEKEGLTAGKYFDITIAVINKDTGATEGTLDVLTEKIKFTIEIPEDLPEVAEGFVRKYYIIRNHIGQVEYLQTELSADGKSLSFETNKFSTYTLAYADVKTTNDDVVEEDGSEEVPGGTIEEPKEESKEESNPEDMNIPNTGDNIVLYVVLAVMAIVGIIAIKKVNTKKNKH